jgi:hypothetical protein
MTDTTGPRRLYAPGRRMSARRLVTDSWVSFGAVIEHETPLATVGEPMIGRSRTGTFAGGKSLGAVERSQCTVKLSEWM